MRNVSNNGYLVTGSFGVTKKQRNVIQRTDVCLKLKGILEDVKISFYCIKLSIRKQNMIIYAAYSSSNKCTERETKCNGNCEGPFRKKCDLGMQFRVSSVKVSMNRSSTPMSPSWYRKQRDDALSI